MTRFTIRRDPVTGLYLTLSCPNANRITFRRLERCRARVVGPEETQ